MRVLVVLAPLVGAAIFAGARTGLDDLRSALSAR